MFRHCHLKMSSISLQRDAERRDVQLLHDVLDGRRGAAEPGQLLQRRAAHLVVGQRPGPQLGRRAALRQVRKSASTNTPLQQKLQISTST